MLRTSGALATNRLSASAARVPSRRICLLAPNSFGNPAALQTTIPQICSITALTGASYHSTSRTSLCGKRLGVGCRAMPFQPSSNPSGAQSSPLAEPMPGSMPEQVASPLQQLLAQVCYLPALL